MLCVCNFSNVSLKGIWWVVLKQPIKKLFKQWSVEIVHVYMCIWIYFVNWYLFFIYYRNRHIVLLYMYKQVINRFRFKCLQFSTFSRFFLLLWKSSVIVLVVWVQIKVYAVIYRSFRMPQTFRIFISLIPSLQLISIIRSDIYIGTSWFWMFN